MTTALLILDAQQSQFDANPVHNSAGLLTRLRDLTDRARAAGATVIFTRREGPPGTAVYPALAAAADEPVIDTPTPDPFDQTRLAGVLAARGMRRLIVAGVRTEYEVDTACRRGRGLGYDVVLASDAHSTRDGALPAAAIIAHHNTVLTAFAQVCLAAEIAFDAPAALDIAVDALTKDDAAGIAAGLAEWPEYERWLAAGEGRPYWPHTHPGRVADALRHLEELYFRPRERFAEPPRWEIGLARSFFTPLENIPPAFRAAAVQSVSKAIDHLLQNPRNPLSPHMRPVGDHLWLYDARDLRLFYVPSTATDNSGAERRYIFLLWLAAGVPVTNPFAF